MHIVSQGVFGPCLLSATRRAPNRTYRPPFRHRTSPVCCSPAGPRHASLPRHALAALSRLLLTSRVGASLGNALATSRYFDTLTPHLYVSYWHPQLVNILGEPLSRLTLSARQRRLRSSTNGALRGASLGRSPNDASLPRQRPRIPSDFHLPTIPVGAPL